MGRMTPLVFLWPYALLFWAAFVWTFFPEYGIVAAPVSPSTRAQDAGSKAMIVFGQALAMLAAFAIARLVPSATLPHRVYLFWIGIAVFVAGGLLRRHCKRMLGSSFTGDVIVRADQAVVDRGAYRYVRHPSYSAGLLIFAGIGLALANGIGLMILLLIVIGGYAYRVRVEERALATTIGDPYREYMQRTRRFIPFLF